jgi:hypothetical protein
LLKLSAQKTHAAAWSGSPGPNSYGRQQQARNTCEFGMGAILNWAEDKENSSKNEQARPSIDHTFTKDRFMPGEEDGLLDDFLGDVRSVHHIAAVPRRQIRHACACAIDRRRRIANACQSTNCIRLRQCPVTLDRLTRPATHMTILGVAALTPACRCHLIT